MTLRLKRRLNSHTKPPPSDPEGALFRFHIFRHTSPEFGFYYLKFGKTRSNSIIVTSQIMWDLVNEHEDHVDTLLKMDACQELKEITEPEKPIFLTEGGASVVKEILTEIWQVMHEDA